MKKVLLLLAVTQLAFATAPSQPRKPAARQAPAKKPAAPGRVTPVALAAGAAVYKQYCLTCHQADGGGVPNLNPSLSQTSWVLGDKARLTKVLLKGLQGQAIDGEKYDNVMPAHDFLTDEQIANVLTYVRNNFDNKASAITANEVKAVRTKK